MYNLVKPDRNACVAKIFQKIIHLSKQTTFFFDLVRSIRRHTTITHTYII